MTSLMAWLHAARGSCGSLAFAADLHDVDAHLVPAPIGGLHLALSVEPARSGLELLRLRHDGLGAAGDLDRDLGNLGHQRLLSEKACDTSLDSTGPAGASPRAVAPRGLLRGGRGHDRGALNVLVPDLVDVERFDVAAEPREGLIEAGQRLALTRQGRRAREHVVLDVRVADPAPFDPLDHAAEQLVGRTHERGAL